MAGRREREEPQLAAPAHPRLSDLTEQTNSVYFPRGSSTCEQELRTRASSFVVECQDGDLCVTEAGATLPATNGGSSVSISIEDLIGAVPDPAEGGRVRIACAVLDQAGVPKRRQHDTIKRTLRIHTTTLKDASRVGETVQMLRHAATGFQCRARRMLVIVNPHGGRHGSTKLFEEVVSPILQYAGMDATVVHTDYAGHAKEIGAAYNPHEYEGVITVSGDGIVNEFMTGLLTRPNWHELVRRTAVCTIKGGTTNAIAAGVRTNDPTYAMWCVIKRKLRPLDAMLVVNGHNIRTLAVCVFGWGMATGVAADSEPTRYLGIYRYSYLKLRHAMRIGKGYERYAATVDISSDVGMTDTELQDYFTVLDDADSGGRTRLRRSWSSVRQFGVEPSASAAPRDVRDFGSVLGMQQPLREEGLVNLQKATAELLQEYQQERVELHEGPPTALLSAKSVTTPVLREHALSFPSITSSSAVQVGVVPGTSAMWGAELDKEILEPDPAQLLPSQPQAAAAATALNSSSSQLQPDGGFGALTLCGPGCSTCAARGRLRYIDGAQVRFDAASAQPEHARAPVARTDDAVPVQVQVEQSTHNAVDGVDEHRRARHRFLARLFKRTRRSRGAAQLGSTIKEPPIRDIDAPPPRPGMVTKADFPGLNYTRTVATGVTRRGFFKRREQGEFATIVAINLAAEALYHHASDGFMDLLVVRRGSLAASLRLAMRYVGQIVGLTDIYGPPLAAARAPQRPRSSPLIDYFKARCMTITPSDDAMHEAANVDGELFPGPGPFKVYTLPSFLTVYGEV